MPRWDEWVGRTLKEAPMTSDGKITEYDDGDET